MERKRLLELQDKDLAQITFLLTNLMELTRREAAENVNILEVYRQNYNWEGRREIYLRLRFALAEYYARNDYIPLAQEYLEDLIVDCELHQEAEQLRRAKANLATSHAQCGFFQQALDTWKAMLEEGLPPQMRLTLLNNMSVAYGILKNPDEGINYAFQAIQLAEEMNEPEECIAPLINLGSQYYTQDKPEKALETWDKAVHMAETYDKKRRLAELQNSISLAHAKLGDKDNALACAHQALASGLEFTSDQDLAMAYNNLGVIHREFGDQGEALSFFRLASEIYENAYDSVAMANVLLNIAELQMGLSEFDAARENLLRSEAMIEEHGITLIRERYLRLCVDYHVQTGDLDKALDRGKELADFLSDALKHKSETTISREEAAYYRGKIEKQNERFKQQNAELRAANTSLTETNELLKRVISIVSHDVRAPLANIIQTLDLVNQGLIDAETQAEIFRELQVSSTRLFDLLNEVLNWLNAARTNSDDPKAKSLVDLSHLIDEITNMYLPIAKAKGIDIQQKNRSDGLKTFSEPYLLAVTIRNLLNNAVKYTSKGGKIELEALVQDGKLRITVADTGTGMSPDQVQKLMNGQLTGMLGTEQEQGFGLGFKLCLDSVRRLGGELQIDSQLGAGTSITVLLPHSES